MMTEVVVTSGAIRRTKLQSNRHRQQTNTQLYTGWMPFLSPEHSVRALKGRLTHHILLNIKQSITVDI